MSELRRELQIALAAGGVATAAAGGMRVDSTQQGMEA